MAEKEKKLEMKNDTGSYERVLQSLINNFKYSIDKGTEYFEQGKLEKAKAYFDNVAFFLGRLNACQLHTRSVEVVKRIFDDQSSAAVYIELDFN